MPPSEWSRSRFWLCHFLHNRHEREPAVWEEPTEIPAALRLALASWLAGDAGRSPINAARFMPRAARQYAHDPAYVQSLRLLLKEQHYHTQLFDRVRQRLGITGPIQKPIQKKWSDLGAAALEMPGVRFELSVALLADLIDAALLRLIRDGSESRGLRSKCEFIARDKRAHAAFHAERLTMELADLNFLRRNLRRLRLRGMFAVALALAAARHGRLITAAGSTRGRFVGDCWREFQTLLERVVPYRREALLAALLAQRERPYDKPSIADHRLVV